MARLNLPYLSAQTRAACPKPTQSRLEQKVRKGLDDKAALAVFRRDVWSRDTGLCRVCGVKVIRTTALNPLRGEVHHLVGRANRVLRTDVRNGILVCLSDHERLTKHDVYVRQVEGRFLLAGMWYLNADKPLQFFAYDGKGSR